jgi:antibiotic biosynthesis monooxygenase (ABM) superfamily enzyme
MSSVELFDEVVTLLVRHRVKAGQDAAYEEWLRRIIGTARSYAGHLGIDVMRGHSQGLTLFTCVLRFTSTDLLQAWLDSDDRHRLVAEVEPLLADGDQTEINADREFWFTPTPLENGSANPPARWKQACVTFLVILPLSMGVPLLWKPLFAQLPFLSGYLASSVLITLSIVLLVVYVFMPRVTRLFAPWLNKA